MTDTKGTKDDNGKPDYTLVPIKGLCDAIEEVRQFGKLKYPDPENWRKLPAMTYWKAFLRHVVKAWMSPEAIDPESGCRHIHHAAFNLACYLELHDTKKQTDCKGCKYMDDYKHEPCEECSRLYSDRWEEK